MTHPEPTHFVGIENESAEIRTRIVIGLVFDINEGIPFSEIALAQRVLRDDKFIGNAVVVPIEHRDAWLQGQNGLEMSGCSESEVADLVRAEREMR